MSTSTDTSAKDTTSEKDATTGILKEKWNKAATKAGKLMAQDGIDQKQIAAVLTKTWANAISTKGNLSKAAFEAIFIHKDEFYRLSGIAKEYVRRQLKPTERTDKDVSDLTKFMQYAYRDSQFVGVPSIEDQVNAIRAAHPDAPVDMSDGSGSASD